MLGVRQFRVGSDVGRYVSVVDTEPLLEFESTGFCLLSERVADCQGGYYGINCRAGLSKRTGLKTVVFGNDSAAARRERQRTNENNSDKVPHTFSLRWCLYHIM